MPRHPETIVMFDDNDEVVEAYRLLFEHDGYTFMSANSPAAALQLYEKIKHNPPRFAIVDVVFKSFSSDKPNGFQLCRQLRDLDPEGIFIVLTGMPDELTRLRLIDSKADAILEKPKSDIEILAAVAKIERERAEAIPKTSSAPSSNRTLAVGFAVLFGALVVGLSLGYHFQAIYNAQRQQEMIDLRRDEDRRFVDLQHQLEREQDMKLAQMDNTLRQFQSSLGQLNLLMQDTRDALSTHGLLNKVPQKGKKR